MKKLILILTLALTPHAFADMDKAFEAEQAGDFETAYTEYLADAEAGNTAAMVMIGLYYAQGLHVEQDQEKSNEWMAKAAALGDPTAELNMAIGHKIGLANLQKDDAVAFKWFMSAAEKGQPQAQYEVGVAYQYGIGIERNFDEARLWYLKAAEQDHSAAQNNLAGIYGEGQGVAVDRELAREWLEKSAENKNHEALFTLGVIYHQAIDVKQDFSRAGGYFRRAFVEGKAEAASYLAEYHYMGKGVGKSPVNAMMWLMLATEITSTVSGGMLAQETLERLDANKEFLAAELSPSDLERAKELKADFVRENLEEPK